MLLRRKRWFKARWYELAEEKRVGGDKNTLVWKNIPLAKVKKKVFYKKNA